MAFLEIGINEGWRLGPKTEVTEKGGIKVHFVKGKAITSALAMMTATDDEIPDESSVLVFPVDVTYKDGSVKDYVKVGKELRKWHSTFRKMFLLYFTEKEVLEDFPVTAVFEKYDITEDNEEAMFTSKSVVTEMFKQLGNMLIAFVKKHKVYALEDFRIKLKRQSDKKAFADFTPFPERDDWIELMSSKPSKVEFTPWERGQGWNNANIPTDVIKETTETEEYVDESEGDDVPEAPVGDQEEFA